ncbi:MAG: carboxylating nicotinate-nucleotide diphosphorylase [Oscillospiraceae bacterium]|jgi:nicotinate-nucleotide pyrophosphorylase (carboxylating)|nr:carboxylating nicotinate-nucleotide diphosphorylase [Oscillospiraceae bacterium]
MLPNFRIDSVITNALQEDVPYLDISAAYLFADSHQSEGYLLSKSEGVLCGIDVFRRTLELTDTSIRFAAKLTDGAPFQRGDVLAEFAGSTKSLLIAERTALNLLQHMTGIASYTAQCVAAVAGTHACIADTRKTLPGLRALEKYAVTCGGGKNHRYCLSDGVMLKDNHIDAAGSITKAIQTVRAAVGHMVKIEVETRNLSEVEEAIRTGADIVMLDNMSAADMAAAVQTYPATVFEASGNITLENIREKAAAGVHIISLGALTHSVAAADISMRIKKQEE